MKKEYPLVKAKKLSFEDCRISRFRNIVYRVLGIVLSSISFFLVFFLFYESFFERELYLKRRKLRKYIVSNGLSKPEILNILSMRQYLVGSGYSIPKSLQDVSVIYTFSIEPYSLLYYVKTTGKNIHCLSLPNTECIIPSFRKGLLSCKDYNIIEKIIKDKIVEYYGGI